MAKRITTRDEYEKSIGDSDKRKHALEYALDIRKFEIELYWKRATYFWTLLAATFAGYFALVSVEKPEPFLIFLVSCIGLVLSIGWYLVNRGSKYWQTNWERHVDLLEDEIIGPLYKTTISNEQFPWVHFWGGYPYSVSKVNQIISLFIVFVWIGIAVCSFPGIILPRCIAAAGSWILAGTTIGFVLFLFILGLGGSQGKSRRVDFHKSEIIPADNDRKI